MTDSAASAIPALAKCQGCNSFLYRPHIGKCGCIRCLGCLKCEHGQADWKENSQLGDLMRLQFPALYQQTEAKQLAHLFEFVNLGKTGPERLAVMQCIYSHQDDLRQLRTQLERLFPNSFCLVVKVARDRLAVPDATPIITLLKPKKEGTAPVHVVLEPRVSREDSNSSNNNNEGEDETEVDDEEEGDDDVEKKRNKRKLYSNEPIVIDGEDENKSENSGLPKKNYRPSFAKSLSSLESALESIRQGPIFNRYAKKALRPFKDQHPDIEIAMQLKSFHYPRGLDPVTKEKLAIIRRRVLNNSRPTYLEWNFEDAKACLLRIQKFVEANPVYNFMALCSLQPEIERLRQYKVSLAIPALMDWIELDSPT